MKLSLILPTYNEAENILPLIEAIAAHAPVRPYEAIVVDDDSPDGTAELVRRHAATHPETRLLHRKGERGLTSALNAGLKASAGEIVGWMDCDLSHPPDLLPALMAELERGADAAIASRYVPGGRDARAGSYALQRRLSLVLLSLGQRYAHLPVKDVTSGYILVRRALLEDAGWLQGDYGEYFIAMVARLQRRGCRFAEIPYAFKNRERGESKTATSLAGYARRGLKYLAMLHRARGIVAGG